MSGAFSDGYNLVLELDPEGVELDPEGVELDPEGVELDPEGVELDPEGVELDPVAEGPILRDRRFIRSSSSSL